MFLNPYSAPRLHILNVAYLSIWEYYFATKLIAFGYSLPSPILLAIPPLFLDWPQSACFIPMPSIVAEHGCFTFLSCADMNDLHPQWPHEPRAITTLCPRRVGDRYTRGMDGPTGCPQSLKCPACQDKGSWVQTSLLQKWDLASKFLLSAHSSPCRCLQVSLPTHLQQALATGTAWKAFHPLTGN